MLENRSLLPKVEVLSRKGDKTSICCIKLLQSVWNFYYHKITKICRGGGVPPHPLRTPENFCQSAKGCPPFAKPKVVIENWSKFEAEKWSKFKEVDVVGNDSSDNCFSRCSTPIQWYWLAGLLLTCFCDPGVWRYQPQRGWLLSP